MAKSTINQIIQKYREQATFKRRMGEDFERLIRDYVMTTKLYASKFAKVWMWDRLQVRGNKECTIIRVVNTSYNPINKNIEYALGEVLEVDRVRTLIE